MIPDIVTSKIEKAGENSKFNRIICNPKGENEKHMPLKCEINYIEKIICIK
jgi:hypothetical protein